MILSSAPGTPSDALTEWITGIMQALGAPGAGLVVLVENVFPPIPSELVLPLAGFTASQGGMNLLGAILWTTIGSVVGAVVLYYLGALLGRHRTRAIAAKLPLVKMTDIDRTEEWFARHGSKAVFLGRMVPIFRSFISLPAGVERMPMLLFLVFTTAGSLIWNTGLIMAGYLLGRSWPVVEGYVGVFQKVVIVAVVLAVGWFVGTRLRRATKARA